MALSDSMFPWALLVTHVFYPQVHGFNCARKDLVYAYPDNGMMCIVVNPTIAGG
jgi:hypothetical protein